MLFLVTGGAGFIGSAVVRGLLAGGHQVRVLDDLSTGTRDNLPPGVDLRVGDIRDASTLEAACTGVDGVIHLAAMVSVARSVTEPDTCYALNVTGTQEVLLGAWKAGARRFVLASSAAVYGNDPTLPKQETMPHDSASAYAYSKWLNEVDAEYYSRYMGLETVCLRFFNVFGPRQRPDSPYSGVISIAAAKLLAGEVFTVNGDGRQSRDFIHVDDVAGAVIQAATLPGLRHEVVNVGRGEQTTLLELLDLLGRALGKAPQLAFGPERLGDVRHSLADVTRLKEHLGYTPLVTLEDGLKETLAWVAGART